MTMSAPKGRGGARLGAGRKPAGKRLTVSLPGDLSARVRAASSYPTVYVRAAVEDRLGQRMATGEALRSATASMAAVSEHGARYWIGYVTAALGLPEAEQDELSALLSEPSRKNG